MRIVRYHPRAVVGDGGISEAIRGWTRALSKAGADVSIAYDPSYLGPAPPAEPAYLPVTHTGRWYTRYPTGMQEALRGADLLVLHSGWVFHNVIAARAARKLGVPYIVEPRGAYDPHIVKRKPLTKRAWWKIFERDLVDGASAVHVFFESEIEHLRELGYEGPAVVAPNGVEIADHLQWKGGEHIVWLGRFDPEHKGIDVLLEGLALLDPAERPSLRLFGPDWRGRKQAVADLISQRGLEPWAQVCEPVYGPDKWDVLSRARGFVYPSRWEGFGIALAEAVAMGIPSLVTPYPLGALLAERDAAFLASTDAESLGAGLLTLATSPRAAEIGRNGARVVRNEFTWDAVARSWLDQVASVIA